MRFGGMGFSPAPALAVGDGAAGADDAAEVAVEVGASAAEAGAAVGGESGAVATDPEPAQAASVESARTSAKSAMTDLISLSPLVIPAKAGIHKSANVLATQNQAPSATGGSLLPLSERARVRARRALARLCRRDARAPKTQACPVQALYRRDIV